MTFAIDQIINFFCIDISGRDSMSSKTEIQRDARIILEQYAVTLETRKNGSQRN